MASATSVYFDTCSLQRPFDDWSQARVRLEAEAILALVSAVISGDIGLVSSEIMDLEVDRGPRLQRRVYARSILKFAATVVTLDEGAERRADGLQRRGCKAFDALHLACAESAQAMYFCTCDDRLLKFARRQKDLHVRVVSPLELAQRIMP